METTFGEYTDSEKKETVISDCSEMRTEGASRPRPSVGLVGTARDDHLPVGRVLEIGQTECSVFALMALISAHLTRFS